jgi:hypothetical protein
MVLFLDQPIIQSDIRRINMLKGGKVWLLTGENDAKIVVKSEASRETQVKTANMIMKAVAPQAMVKALSFGERVALSNYVISYQQIKEAYSDLGVDYNPDEDLAIEALKDVMEAPQNYTFVKMAFVNVMDLQAALEKRLSPAGNKTDLRAFTATLIATGGLEKLGRIIAVDLFNTNTDRFYPGSAHSATIHGTTFNLRVLVNIGNVFRIDLGNGGSELGALDFVDFFSDFKDMNTRLIQAERDNDDLKWMGRLLADAQRRKAFADYVVHDLELLLNPHKSRWSLRSKLGSNAASRVSNGMVEGAKRIGVQLQRKHYRGGSWTSQAVYDRYKIMSQVS